MRASQRPLARSAALEAVSIGRRVLIYFGAAIAVAALMSTQFLAQPFVWTFFDGQQILHGWRLIFQGRLLVASSIAGTLLVLDIILSHRRRRTLWHLFLAVVLGALLGELALATVDPDGNRNDVIGIGGRVLLWAIAVGIGCLIYQLWQRGDTGLAQRHAAELRRLRAERLLRRLRIESLQRQIEPHFLFNTLATIRRLQRANVSDGQVLLSRFCQFLRSNLDTHVDIYGRLGDELAVASAYLDICAVRMEGLLTWRMDVPDELLKKSFPRFGLVTLLENAVKHGIAPAPSGGSIVITAVIEQSTLVVIVADTGVGFTGDLGHGLGLANISEQLELRYGPAASLSLTANRPTGVRACIRVPLEQAQ